MPALSTLYAHNVLTRNNTPQSQHHYIEEVYTNNTPTSNDTTSTELPIHLEQLESIKQKLLYTNETAKVIILTYSRSGSSFLGELFNQHPRGFYTFEPLKGLYSALYGLGDVNEASSSVFQYENHTAR